MSLKTKRKFIVKNKLLEAHFLKCFCNFRTGIKSKFHCLKLCNKPKVNFGHENLGSIYLISRLNVIIDCKSAILAQSFIYCLYQRFSGGFQSWPNTWYALKQTNARTTKFFAFWSWLLIWSLHYFNILQWNYIALSFSSTCSKEKKDFSIYFWETQFQEIWKCRSPWERVNQKHTLSHELLNKISNSFCEALLQWQSRRSFLLRRFS